MLYDSRPCYGVRAQVFVLPPMFAFSGTCLDSRAHIDATRAHVAPEGYNPQDIFKENNPFARTFRKGCYIDIKADSYLSATHCRLIFSQTRPQCSLQHPLTKRRSYWRLPVVWSCAQMEWNP